MSPKSSRMIEPAKTGEEMVGQSIPCRADDSTISDTLVDDTTTTEMDSTTMLVDGKQKFVAAINACSDPSEFVHIGPQTAKLVLSARPFDSFDHFADVLGQARARKIYVAFH